MQGPCRELALGNMIVEVPDGEIGIVPCEVVRLGPVKVQDALIGLEVELDKETNKLTNTWDR